MGGHCVAGNRLRDRGAELVAAEFAEVVALDVGGAEPRGERSRKGCLPRASAADDDDPLQHAHPRRSIRLY